VAAGKEAAQHVGETASEEARKVAGEAKTQAKSLLSDLQTDLRDQAGKQQEKIAGNLRSMSDEFNTMLGASSGGQGSDLVQMAGQRVDQVASWLENRDPGTMLEEVRRFARRRPGAFLAIAAGAGLVAGRLARNLAAEAGSESSQRPSHLAPGPVRPSAAPSAWPADTTPSGAVGTSPAGGAGMTPPGSVGTTVPGSVGIDEGSSIRPPANPAAGSSETYP
jgi:vacuolar-type H+-ATPase subunit H